MKFDNQTRKWFYGKPYGTETTVVKCEKCRLYYKPMLGHICRKERKNEQTTIKGIRTD